MYDASDRKQVRKAEKDAKIAEKLRGDWLRNAMGTIAGRAWFWGLLSRCELFHESANFDTNYAFFAKGQRNIGLSILADIHSFCPDLYLVMLQEQNVKAQANERRNPDSPADASNNDGADDYGGSGPDESAAT